MADVVDITGTEEWRSLADHFEAIKDVHLRQLFADDPDRGTQMTVEAGDLYLDYSKHRVTDETVARLVAVARRAGLEERRDAMFAGRHINTTEDRAVLHVALRMPAGTRLEVDGQDVVADVHQVLDRMGELAERIRSGSGPATPAGGSRRWSTSGSAAPTSVRPWPTRRCATTPPGHHVPVRLQHRPGRPLQQDPRPRPGRDPVRGRAPRPSPPWRR